MKLYKLTHEYRTLAQRLAEIDVDDQAVADTIEGSGLPEAIAEKAQGCEMVARMIEADIPAIDAEIKRLQDLKKARQTKAKGLRNYVLSNMLDCGMTRIDSPLFSISIAKNPPSVEIFDEAMIPAEYMVTPPPSPDKKALAAAIKSGAEIPGARIKQGYRLSIK